MIYLELDDSVKQILQKTFPGYTGRTIKCQITNKVTFTGTNWSGGLKNEYKILHLPTMKCVSVKEANWFNPDKGYLESQTIPAEFIVVCYTIGHRQYITIFSPTELVNKRITNKELTIEEKIVLSATKSFKSSYGGIKNYRFHEAKRTGITEEVWNQTKQNCILKGYLNKAGAITTEGRNLISSIELHNLKLGEENVSL